MTETFPCEGEQDQLDQVVLYNGTINAMNKKHQRTLEAIFKEPVQSNILWSDIEKMFAALGADISEGSGSRVRVALNGVRAVFHRPHPKKETDKGAIKHFLKNAGEKS